MMDFVERWRALSAEERDEIRRELDIPSAVVEHVNEHVKLKTMLADYINGTQSEQLDPEVIRCDDQCALGRWLRGEGVAFLRDCPALYTVRADHAQFHFLGAIVVQRIHEKDQSSARALMSGEFERASHKVVKALLELNNQVEGKALDLAFLPPSSGQ